MNLQHFTFAARRCLRAAGRMSGLAAVIIFLWATGHAARAQNLVQPKGAKVQGLDVTAHARNFFDCVKSRAATITNPQVMRHSHIACHAAAIAWILNRKLTFDPAKERFVNDDEANGLRARPQRDPWSV